MAHLEKNLLTFLIKPSVLSLDQAAKLLFCNLKPPFFSGCSVKENILE